MWLYSPYHAHYLPTQSQAGRRSTKHPSRAQRAGGHTLICRTPALMCALLPTYTAHPKPAQRRCPSPAEILRSYPGKPTYLCIPPLSTKPHVQVERARVERNFSTCQELGT